jgi:tRNA(Ile)-lysidine synthase
LLLRALGGRVAARAPELGKVESLLGSLTEASQTGHRFKQSLAGMTISIEKGRLAIRTAPPRRPVSKAAE